MDIPLEAINDTLEGLEGELTHKIANVGAFIKNLEAEAAKIKDAEQAIAARRKVYENKVARMKDYLKDNMEKSGIKKVQAVDGTFAVTLIAPRASLVIDDEAAIDAAFKSERVVIDIDKAAIKSALESGSTVDGAHLDYKSGLRIA
jgi:soluble cytochrome b562